jgi:hypothetical protein
MPSLISETERANLTGIFNDIFDTFQRRIVIYKEPIRTRVAVNPENMVYGFGESQGEDAFTYTQVTGVYPATVRYADQPTTKPTDIPSQIPKGQISIKVKRDCRDFINSGITEKIVVDEKTWVIDGDERKQSFLDSEFWVFLLKTVK